MALAAPLRAHIIIRAALAYHNRTPSPNSGWPMSAAAGALNIRLEKPGYYILLDEGKKPDPSDIRRSLSYMVVVSALTLALFIAVQIIGSNIAGFSIMFIRF